MVITITQKGRWDKTTRYLKRVRHFRILSKLDKYGQQGVAALSSATPVESSETANSWYYEIIQRDGYYSIRWRNRHVDEGFPVAVMLQYGHGTGTGGYVQGRDYIMPVIRPIFDKIAEEAWREVTR